MGGQLFKNVGDIVADVQGAPAELSPYAADTFTWLVSMWGEASDLKGKHRALMVKGVEVISLMTIRTTAEMMEEHAAIAVFDEDEPCMVSNGGRLHVFRLCASAPHAQLSNALVATWDRKYAGGILDSK